MARNKKETTVAIDPSVLENGTVNEQNDNAQLPTTENDSDDDDDDKVKRERVDLESLDPNTKVMFAIPMPAGMKLAIIKAGEADTLNGSTWARNILAQRLEYVIPEDFTKRTRSSKYESEEAKKAAQQAAQQEQREKIAKLLAAMDAGDIDSSILDKYADVKPRTRKRKSAETVNA